MWRSQRSTPGRRPWPILALAFVVLTVVASSCAADPGLQRTAGDGAALIALPEASPEGVAAVYEAAEAFAEAPRSDRLEDLVAAIGAHPDPRWTPYLLDIVRIGFSSATLNAATDLLPLTTGVPATGQVLADYTTWGATVLTSPVDPGPPYRGVKTALYDAIDPAISDVLETVQDPQVLIGLQWGGVPLGGIAELNDPVRAASVPDWATPDELVLGAEVDDVAVLYPLRVLSRHELANDTVQGRPIALAYCTLCRSALLFDRMVDGQVLDFQTSGLLLESNKVMIDRQTGSLWQQLTGEAIAGPLVGAQLELLPVVTTTWSAWVDTHPDTQIVDLPEAFVIDPETGVPATYAYTVEGGQAVYSQSDTVWYPVLAPPPGSLELKDEVATVQLGGAALAVEVDALAAHGPLALAVGGGSAANVVVVPVAGGGAAFFDATDANLAVGEAVEVDGDPLGRTVRAAGRELSRLSSGQSFWFAWYGIHPETDWWPAEG